MATTTPRYTEIVTVAARLFATKGYGATSVQDIADDVGMLKGSLYHHISGKQALLVAVIQSVHDSALDRLSEARKQAGSPLETLSWFISDHVMYNIDHLNGIRVYFQEFRSLDAPNADRIWRDRLTYDRFVRKLVIDAQMSGEADGTVDPSDTAIAILALMNWVYQWYDPSVGVSPRATAATIASQGIRLLTTGRAA